MAKILVVEDDSILSKAYQLILKGKGHEVNVAANGQEALDLVAKQKPEVILLDLLMPVLNGIEFLEQYKPGEPGKAKVIIMSNLGDEKKVNRAMELGSYKYIIKAHATPMQLSLMVGQILKENHPGKSN